MNSISKLFLTLLFSWSFLALQASETTQVPTPADGPALATTEGPTPLFSTATINALNSVGSRTLSFSSNALDFAENHWKLALMILGAVTVGKPILKFTKNFAKYLFVSVFYGDPVENIQKNIAELQTRIIALPEEQRTALREQAATIQSRIDELARTSQERTNAALATTQKEISALRENIERIEKTTEEQRQRLQRLAEGQETIQESIDLLDERVRAFEFRTNGQLNRIAGMITGRHQQHRPLLATPNTPATLLPSLTTNRSLLPGYSLPLELLAQIRTRPAAIESAAVAASSASLQTDPLRARWTLGSWFSTYNPTTKTGSAAAASKSGTDR